MPLSTDPVKSWPGKAGIKTGGPSVFKSRNPNQPVLNVLYSNGATSINAEGYSSLNGGAFIGNNLQVNGLADFYGYYDGTTATIFRIHTQKPSGGNSTLSVIGNGTVNVVSNSAAAETLRLQTRGATTKSLVIEDLRDNSTVLSIDTDGNFSGTSSATSWKTFTSGITGTGWAIGDGTITARYTRLGATLSFHIVVQFGSTSTYGTVAPKILISPAGVDADTGVDLSFNATYVDASTGDRYPGRAVVNDGEPNDPTLYVIASPLTPVLDTAPFTWTTGDRIVLSGTYVAE